MSIHHWSQTEPSDDLGVVVHGPVLLAASSGIAAGLRCVFGYPTGLTLLVALRAAGVQAQAAVRQTKLRPTGIQTGVQRWSELSITAELNGLRGPVFPHSMTTSSGEEQYDLDGQLWIDQLPDDGALTLVTAWPEAGLSAATVQLTLTGLEDIQRGVIRLG